MKPKCACMCTCICIFCCFNIGMSVCVYICVLQEHPIFAWVTVCNWFWIDWIYGKCTIFPRFSYLPSQNKFSLSLSLSGFDSNIMHSFVLYSTINNIDCMKMQKKKYPSPNWTSSNEFNWFQLQKICIHAMKYHARNDSISSWND